MGSGCFSDPTTVATMPDGTTSAAGTTEAVTSGDGSTDGTTASDPTTDGEAPGSSTTSTGGDDDDAAESSSSGASGACGCGVHPDLGIWCGPDLDEPSGSALCRPDVADQDGQPCDAVDPPIANAGCCLDGGTVVFCYEGQILVEACSPATFDSCA